MKGRLRARFQRAPRTSELKSKVKLLKCSLGTPNCGLSMCVHSLLNFSGPDLCLYLCQETCWPRTRKGPRRLWGLIKRFCILHPCSQYTLCLIWNILLKPKQSLHRLLTLVAKVFESLTCYNLHGGQALGLYILCEHKSKETTLKHLEEDGRGTFMHIGENLVRRERACTSSATEMR